MYIRRTEIYLKQLRNLNVLMDTGAGLRRLIYQLPISIGDAEKLIENASGFVLADFRGIELSEIIDTFKNYILAFAIKNNLI